MLTGIYKQQQQKKSATDLSVLEGNKHKHEHTPGASVFCLSSRYQIGAWHRTPACVSRSFISYTNAKSWRQTVPLGLGPPYLTHYYGPPTSSSHSKSSLAFLLWLSLPETDLQKEIFYFHLIHGGYRNILHSISHRFPYIVFLYFDQEWYSRFLLLGFNIVIKKNNLSKSMS